MDLRVFLYSVLMVFLSQTAYVAELSAETGVISHDGAEICRGIVVLRTLNKGETVEILGKLRDWFEVKVQSATETTIGWVNEKSLVYDSKEMASTEPDGDSRSTEVHKHVPWKMSKEAEAILGPFRGKRISLSDEECKEFLERGDAALPILFEGLQDTDFDLRANSAWFVHRIRPGSVEAVHALGKLLTHPTVFQGVTGGQEVIILLSKIGTTEAARAIVEGLNGSPRVFRGMLNWSENGILKIGPPAVPALLDALKDKEPQVRKFGAQVIWKIKPYSEDVVPALIVLLDDQVRDVRLSASYYLRNFGSLAASAVPSLIKLLADEDPDIRSSAAETISIVEPSSTEALAVIVKTFVSDKDEDTSIGLIGALSRMARPEAVDAVPALIKALNNKEAGISAAHALGKIGPAAVEAVQPLIAQLTSKDETMRESAAVALGGIGPAAKQAVPALDKLLDDEYSIVRDRAATAIEKITGKRPKVRRRPITIMEMKFLEKQKELLEKQRESSEK